MRCGFCIFGLTYQISGHSQGSRRNILAMPQSVSPRLTTWFFGALAFSAGPASAMTVVASVLSYATSARASLSVCGSAAGSPLSAIDTGVGVVSAAWLLREFIEQAP